MSPDLPVRVIVGVDGSGRTRRLREAVAVEPGPHVVVPRRAGEGDAPEVITAAGTSALLVLDDAHDRPDEVIRLVLAAVHRGARVVMSRRPGMITAALGELEDAVVETGILLTLGPLDIDEVTRQLVHADRTAVSPEPGEAERLLSRSGGAAWVVAALAADRSPDGERRPDGGGDSWPTLRAATERRLARLAPEDAALAELLAVAASAPSEVDPTVLAAAFGTAVAAPDPPARLAAGTRQLRLSGLLAEAAAPRHDDRLVPAVAAVIDAALTVGERRARFAQLATGMRVAGVDPLVGAAGEIAFRSGSPDETLAAAGRWAAQGRTDRVAQCLVASGVRLHRLLAVPALVATGDGERAGEILDGPGETSLDTASLLARSALALHDRPPGAALPRLIETAESFVAAGAACRVPQTPHAVAAVVAVAAADAATAERLLRIAGTAGAGGPPARDRHRLLAAWVRLRAGGGDPSPVLQETAGVELDPRDAMLRAVLLAGWARRRSDIAALRSCWSDVAAVLARRAVDLFAAEPAEELVLAAARLDQHSRAAPLVADLEAMAPPGVAAWRCALAWTDLQVAVLGDDPGAAGAAATALEAAAALPTAGPRQQAQARAAVAWSAALAGDVDQDTVLTAVDDLVGDAELPWEAGRLAGQAALRSTDPRVARRLLERARDLSVGPDHRHQEDVGVSAAGPAGVSGVSERELEVAQLVLAGRTHREIGAQLYISPKTVEHHVARIRTKVGARDRAEFMSALRSLVAGQADPGR